MGLPEPTSPGRYLARRRVGCWRGQATWADARARPWTAPDSRIRPQDQGDLRPAAEDNSCAQANPRLPALAALVGEWTTAGTHPLVPGKTFHGHATFSWLESGAFLLLHSQIDEPEVPDGVAILATDDAVLDAGAMLYFHARGVSREYRRTISGNVWTWWRDAPNFSQRMALTIAEDGQRIEARGLVARRAGVGARPPTHVQPRSLDGRQRTELGRPVRSRPMYRGGVLTHLASGRPRGPPCRSGAGWVGQVSWSSEAGRRSQPSWARSSRRRARTTSSSATVSTASSGT